MTQDAVVTRILKNGMAEVAVERGTACGGSCGSCEVCVFDNHIKTEAVNKISAMPGQKVVIETKSSKIYGALFLVYILPFIMFLIGYAAAYSSGLGETACMLISFAAFAVGVAIMVITQRMKKKEDEIVYEIVHVRD